MTDEAVRAMADRIEELDRACSEWADASQANYQRAKTAEAKLAKAVEAATLLADAAHHAVGHLTGYGDTSTARINLREAVEHLRATLAELTGGKDE